MDFNFGGAEGGGGGGGGQVGQFPLEQWFFETPPVTRWWTASTLATSLLVQCEILTPFHLFYSYRAVFVKNQFWRLLTNFLYFGPLSLDLLFHIFFLQRYSRLLEEASGRSPAQFSWLLLYATVILLVVSPYLGMTFLGHPLQSILVYIWARRNPETRLSFLGLLVFRAPYLPFVLMAFSFLLHGNIPRDEMCGAVIGHVWYYFSDVYPPLHNDHRPLDSPAWWHRIVTGRWPEAYTEIPVPDATNNGNAPRPEPQAQPEVQPEAQPEAQAEPVNVAPELDAR